MAQAVKTLAGSRKITKIVGGIPGPLNKQHSGMTFSILENWANKPMRTDLRRLTGVPIVIGNDAGLVGLGEATVGAGQGYGIVAYITVSTGVGGTRIVHGHIDQSALGFEPGFQIVSFPAKASLKPVRLGKLISGHALAKKYGRLPKTIKNQQVWQEAARALAVGLVNVTVFWSPDVIVVGGSVAKDIPLAVVRRWYKKYIRIFPHGAPIVRGNLGDVGGLHGALHLAQSS